jgi:hypothetical protein
LLIPLALVGAQWAYGALVDRGTRVAAIMATVGLALVVWSVAMNAALAIDYGRHGSPDVRPDLRAAYITTQLDAPGGSFAVAVGDTLPAEVGRDRSLFVLGDCDALYQSDGRAWQPVERSEAAGHFDLRVTVPDAATGIEPLIGSGTPGDANLLAIEYLDDDRVRFLSAWDYDGGGVEESLAVELGAGSHDLDVVLDPNINEVAVSAGDELLFRAPYFHPRPGWVLGETVGDGAGPLRGRTRNTFSGEIESRPIATPVCERVRGQAGASS